MAGRPHRITPALASQINDLRAKGVSNLGIVRSLAGRGAKLDRKTLARWIAANDLPSRAAPPHADPGEPCADPGAPCAADAPDASASALEAASAAALDGDDLASIARCATEVRAALREWSISLGTYPAGARTYATLARLNADLSARLVELRPRSDAESDRLSDLAEPARRALLERARAVAREDEDLRGRNQRLRQMLDAATAEGR